MFDDKWQHLRFPARTSLALQWLAMLAAVLLCMQLLRNAHDVYLLCGVLAGAAIAYGIWRGASREHVAQQCDRMLASKLQHAFDAGGISVAFQPIYEADGRIVAAETLSRWTDAEEGAISPARFIPLAETTGLIVPLNEWVLLQACEQMRKWLDAGLPIRHIAVNVSVLQIWRDDFVPVVKKILARASLPPQYLELEVTESALCRDFELVKKNLQALRVLGVRISIDDFGTGYSSLGRLRELDADVLKIDRSFVNGASESLNGVKLVEAIISMAHSLGLTVVAEGVETREQLELLTRMGCDAFQGFFLSRAVAAEEIVMQSRRAMTISAA